nr:hypothetical protein GCM10017745_66890 [Saccharothrix mutabilis subsp. capreolus]
MRLDPAVSLAVAGVLVVAVGPVGIQPVGPTARPSRPCEEGWDGVEQWQQLGDVIAVGTSQRHR